MNNIGIIGELTPYLLRSNEWVVAILLCCFITTCYVFSKEKGIITLRIRKFFISHRHETTSNTFHNIALILQCCLLIGILMTYYQTKNTSFIQLKESPLFLLGNYCTYVILFCICKWFIYNFINWIFFEKRENKAWTESYFLTISAFGVILFPITLLIVFLDLPQIYCGIFLGITFILGNLLLLYKAFCIFFNGLHGLFYLFLYFCTLEILPTLIIWKGIDSANSILT